MKLNAPWWGVERLNCCTCGFSLVQIIKLTGSHTLAYMGLCLFDLDLVSNTQSGIVSSVQHVINSDDSAEAIKTVKPKFGRYWTKVAFSYGFGDKCRTTRSNNDWILSFLTHNQFQSIEFAKQAVETKHEQVSGPDCTHEMECPQYTVKSTILVLQLPGELGIYGRDGPERWTAYCSFVSTVQRARVEHNSLGDFTPETRASL